MFVNLTGSTCCAVSFFPAASTLGECFCSAADFSHLLLPLLPPQPHSCVNFIPDFFENFFETNFVERIKCLTANQKVISAAGTAFCVRFLLSQEFYSQQCINGVIFYLSAACREMLLIQADKILICMLGSKSTSVCSCHPRPW